MVYKDFCLIWIFKNSYVSFALNKPKQNEKMGFMKKNRKISETDSVLVLFGSNQKLL
jgi:hypothetical protein